MILKYLQLPFRFDIPRLQAEVAQLQQKDWKLHYQTLHYQGEWTALPLRSIDGKPDSVLVSPDPDCRYDNTPFLEECPYLQQVLSRFECPLMAVRLLRLPAGSLIKEHRDADLCFEQGEVRIHIPVTSHDEVYFWLVGERLRLEEGSCWYLNVNLPHSVRNEGPGDRIHLVIDARVNAWVKNIFAQPLLKKSIEAPTLSGEEIRQIIFRLKAMNTETSMRIAAEMEASLERKP